MSRAKTGDDLRHLEAEREVLRALWLDARVMESLEAQGLQAADFDLERHRLVYRAMQATRAAGLELDSGTVSQALREMGRLERAGGLRTLGETMEGYCSPASAPFWAAKIRERAATRAMLGARDALGQAILEGTSGELRAAMTQLEKCEKELAILRTGEAESNAWRDLNATWLDKQLDPQGADTPVVSTGFAGLDEALDGGFRGGQLIMLLAPPKRGKSFLAFQGFARAALQQRVRTCGFSLEMPQEEQLVRWYVAETGIAPRAFTKRDARAHQVTNLIAAHAEVSTWPLHLWDISDVSSVADIAARTTSVHRKTPVGLVIVDHLLFIDNGRRDADQRADIETSTRGLKKLAVDINAPVICLSHPTQDAARNKSKMGLYDGKGSIAIAGDADVVLEVRIDNQDPSKKDFAGRWPATLAIIGGRNVAECKSFDLRFRGSHYRFEEV